MAFIVKFAVAICLVPSFIYCFNLDSKENYGPYTIDWTDYRMCPRNTKEVIFYTAMSKPVPNQKTNYLPDPIFRYNITILAPVQIDGMKIEFYSVKNGTKALIVNKKVEELCRTSYLTLLTSLQFFKFKANSKLCILTKNNYVFELNFTEIARLILGDQFFYGEYYVRSKIFSKSKVVICLIMCSSFKKTKETQNTN